MKYKPVRLFSLAVAALLLIMSTSSVQAQGLGIAAGLNFNQLDDINTGSGQATFENAQGWHVALWYDLPLGPVAVRPGVRYMDAGKLFEDEEGALDFQSDVNVQLIEIPIDLRLRFASPIVTPYVMAGPVLRFPTSEDEGRLESFSFAGGIGAGVALGFGGVKLFPEFKYTFGISRFTQDEYTIGGITFSPDEDQQMNTIMLSLGVGL